MPYGTLYTDTINASTGVLATQNGMTGIAKAWVAYNGITQTILSSFNVSSVTYNAVGDYTVNFTTAMANANYGVSGTAGYSTTGLSCVCVQSSSYPPTTSALRVQTPYVNGTLENKTFVSVSVFGS
jgi:hypothetical protein